MRHSAHGLGTSAPTRIAIVVLLGVDTVYEFLGWQSSSSPTRVGSQAYSLDSTLNPAFPTCWHLICAQALVPRFGSQS